MKTKQATLDNTIIRMISDSKGIDCSFIVGTNEFYELKSFFLRFFTIDILNDFKCEKIARKCYKYRNYMIKFGEFHRPEYILKDKNIVKIYYKKNFKIINGNHILYLGVEVQDYLNLDEDVDYMDLYDVYKSLRDRNLIWFDIKPDNVVKKDGITYIIDTDYIFKEDDDNKVHVKSFLTDKFNEIYLREKKLYNNVIIEDAK